MSLHRVIASRSWTDPEPDTLRVSLELDGSTAEPCIVFTGNSTWLEPGRAREVQQYIGELVDLAAEYE